MFRTEERARNVIGRIIPRELSALEIGKGFSFGQHRKVELLLLGVG
jgi:hypothetical protein